MATPRTIKAPSTLAEIPDSAKRARQSYIDGVTVRAILADAKCSLDQLYFWLDGAPQPDGSTLLAPIPRRRIIVRGAGRAGMRAALVVRIMRATELQVHRVEQHLARENAAPTEREHDARMLAVIIKTMRDLMAFDAQNAAAPDKTKPVQAADEFIPRDVDELRRELARRVEELRRRRADSGPAGGA